MSFERSLVFRYSLLRKANNLKVQTTMDWRGSKNACLNKFGVTKTTEK